MNAHRTASDGSAIPPRGGSWWQRALALAAVALTLTCGGPEGSGTEGARVNGVAWYSGPVRGATVVLHQVVDGVRTRELGRDVSDENGAFSIEHDGFDDVEIEVLGGMTAEASGGEVSLDNSHQLRGFVLDLEIGEQRSGVVVSVFTHLTLSLGRARLASGTKESTYDAAVGKALERVSNHLTFDPTRTPISPVSAATGSPTEPVKYGLALAGLSEMAALVAAAQGVTVQNVNTASWLAALDRDASSAEALFDGVGAAPLFVGASCAPPPGCDAQGPGCFAACHSSANTLRARLGSAILAFLRTPENDTTLTRDDVATWLEECRIRVDPDLFGNEPAELFDAVGPTITWGAPAVDAEVSGVVAIEVTASDPVGVVSLTVTAQAASPIAITDMNPDPERFEAAWSTVGLDDGRLTLTATAIDAEGNPSEVTRDIIVNNIDGGTVSGVVFKGRVDEATVRVYRFDDGVRGELVGQGETQSNGAFSNIMVADGVAGPLLIEAGFGGTYNEEAATATVTLDVADRLRTVVPAYDDGDAATNLSVTPLTTFAVAYLGWLVDEELGGTTLPARWTTARAAMESQFGVANVFDLTPQAPMEMSTFNAQARYGMTMVGFSELARAASTLGGGDGGTFGSAMNAMRVVRVLETDVSDGCWDGRGPAGAQLYFGGTRAVTVRSTRLDLANAIVAYLDDGARNQTPYAGAADVLSQLDVLASGGGNAAPGSCTATNALNPDEGEDSFDQTPPTVEFLGPLSMPPGSTPPAGHVRGVITVEAVASDNLDLRPSLKFIAPAMTADADGDETDDDARHTFDTTALPDGPLTVTLEAEDAAGNFSDPAMSTRVFIVDNTPPGITFNVADGSWHPAPGPNVTYTVTEMNVASTTALLNGAPFSNGALVSAMGQHTLVVTVQDQAGANTSRSVTFYVDGTAPTLTLGPVTLSGSVVRGTLSVTVTADDNLKALGSLGAAISVTATGPGGPVTPTSVTPSVLGDMRRQLIVTFNTAQLPDGMLNMVFNVSDRAGNAATQLALARTMDNTAPVPTTNMVHNIWYASAPTVTCGQTDLHQGTTTATLNGSPFTCGTMVGSEGQHTLVVTATDAAGNTETLPVTFYVDLNNPTLSTASVVPSWIRQSVTVLVTADDSMRAFGSLNSNIVVTASGPGGAVSTNPMHTTLGNGQRQVELTIDTTLVDDASGGGMLTLRFDVTDRSGRPAVQLVITRMMDNTPPTVALLPVQNQDGAIIPGFINETTATVRGTVTPLGGSPVTVTVTVAPGAITTMVSPDAAGNWSFVTPALAEGSFNITATAADLAGNSSNAAGGGFTVDRTAPVIELLPSTVRDERACDVAFNIDNSTGMLGNPAVNYGACGDATDDVRLDTSTVSTEIGKFTTRLDGVSNPLLWSPRANDGPGGVGLEQAGSTIQFRIYRNAQPPPAIWVDTSSPMLANGLLAAQSLVTAAQWPELRTHTAPFTIELRATDRLGNTTAATMTTVRSWYHRPLAPPVKVRYVGPTDHNDLTLGDFSLFNHSLTPGFGQIGPASAMSSGFIADAPRGLYTFEVRNPHAEPVNVGFYLPSFAGGTYSTRVWEVNPYITGTNGIVNNPPAGTCGWPSRMTTFRMTGGSAPFSCGAGTTCTCISPIADVKPAATNGVITNATLRVVAWDATAAMPVRLTPQTLSPMVEGHTFYEFTVPARASTSNVATHLRVMIALPNLDLFSPADDVANQIVLESDGANAEVHTFRSGTNSFTPTMTAVFKERWADCRDYNTTTNNCTAMHARRRLRATVQVALNVPTDTLKLRVRTRALAATTAIPEPIPAANSADGALGDNHAAATWGSCEAVSPFPCPTIPDYANGAAF